jgi:hypothetical protein
MAPSRPEDLHRVKQFGAVGLMHLMPGLGDLDRHGFGDVVREGTMVVGRDCSQTPIAISGCSAA